MRIIKFGIAVVLLGVVGLFAYDGVQVLDPRRNIVNTASEVASAAAHAIATSKECANAPATTTGGTKPAAATNASTAAATKGCASARAVADKAAQSQGDVVTSFIYDPVAVRVSVTVSGSAKSLVLHFFDRSLTDNIHASSSARPY